MTITNLNTAASGIVGVEINGNYTAFDSIGDTSPSPYSVLSGGVFLPIYTTQVIASQESLQLEVNLSASAFQLPIPRTSSISISLVTAAQNEFTFSIQPPVAQFNVQNINPSDGILNASSSYSPDTGIQVYNWEIVNLNQGGINLPTSTLSGKSVQYFPSTSSSFVTLTVADDYGLVSSIFETIPNTQSTPPTTGVPPSCSSSLQDVQLFVCPYLNQLEKIRAALMHSYNPGQSQSYGYYAPTTGLPYGLTCGANIEPSPGIGIGPLPTQNYNDGGYHDTCVAIDNNFEGSKSLDYFNSANSILLGTPGFPAGGQPTNIFATVTELIDNDTWYGYGGCTGNQVKPFFYPSSFGVLDRREAEYGFTDNYPWLLLQPGINIGGIGNPGCGGAGGQTWYLQAYTNPATTTIVSEFPSPQAPGINSDLEELSFVIDELFAQCVASGNPNSVSCTGPNSWQQAYQNAMSQYPFAAPRQALHFIQATRATGAWAPGSPLANVRVDGLTPLQMVTIAIQQIFTPTNQIGPMGVGGAVSPSDGSLVQSWGGGVPNTPEPNFQAMVAFNPNMPSWFSTTSCVATATMFPTLGLAC